MSQKQDPIARLDGAGRKLDVVVRIVLYEHLGTRVTIDVQDDGRWRRGSRGWHKCCWRGWWRPEGNRKKRVNGRPRIVDHLQMSTPRHLRGLVVARLVVVWAPKHTDRRAQQPVEVQVYKAAVVVALPQVDAVVGAVGLVTARAFDHVQNLVAVLKVPSVANGAVV